MNPPNEPKDMKRRGFLGWLLGTSVGALMVSILYPVFRYMSPPHVPEATTNQVEAGPTNDPEFLGAGFKIIRFGADPVIVLRVGDADFRAFSATCTHLDCIVEYQKGHKRIWCNCHNGEYDLSGRNVAGPPPKPLLPYKVDIVTRGAEQAGLVVVSRA